MVVWAAYVGCRGFSAVSIAKFLKDLETADTTVGSTKIPFYHRSQYVVAIN